MQTKLTNSSTSLYVEILTQIKYVVSSLEIYWTAEQCQILSMVLKDPRESAKPNEVRQNEPDGTEKEENKEKKRKKKSNRKNERREKGG